jgi:hypothetical protein
MTYIALEFHQKKDGYFSLGMIVKYSKLGWAGLFKDFCVDNQTTGLEVTNTKEQYFSTGINENNNCIQIPGFIVFGIASIFSFFALKSPSSFNFTPSPNYASFAMIQPQNSQRINLQMSNALEILEKSRHTNIIVH